MWVQTTTPCLLLLLPTAAACPRLLPALPWLAGKMKALAREVRGFSGRTRLPIYAASAICVRYDPGALAGWIRQSGAVLESLLACQEALPSVDWGRAPTAQQLATWVADPVVIYCHLSLQLPALPAPPTQTAWTRCGR